MKKGFAILIIGCLSQSAWGIPRGVRGADGFLSFFTRSTFPKIRLFSEQASSTSKQIYSIPTYDAAFKWMLSDNQIRPSFFHAFIPGLNIQSSQRLDEHMNPLEKLQTLRDFLHKKTTSTTVKALSGSKVYVVNPSSQKKRSERDEAATAFLMEMVGRFDEIKMSFPKPRFNGTMDFVCKLDNNDYALVEMQVIPHDYWDRRALAYVAAFYGNQLLRGQEWKHIRKVIGVNILGGGKDDKIHWSDEPNHFMRHYKFEDQLNGKGRFIDGIELIQYSIMKAPTQLDQERQDWITFFKEAHYMSKDDVKARIKTPAVLKAFERVEMAKWPLEVEEAYKAEDEDYDRYSDHTKDLVNKGKAEGLAEGKKIIARNMLAKQIAVDVISQVTGLSVEEVQGLDQR